MTLFYLIAASVIFIQVAIGWAILVTIGSWEDRANFGEMFGAVNTLFSGLAFTGIVYTIYLQKRELQLQREDLSMTREELRRSAEAQEKSERALFLTAKLNALNSSIQLSVSKINRMRADGYRADAAGVEHEQSKLYRDSERLDELLRELDQSVHLGQADGEQPAPEVTE